MPTAVVTGCNSGIGHAFAKILCDEGYKVYAIDKHIGIPARPLEKARLLEVDVTSTSSINAFKNDIGNETIDLLLNIAGIMAPPMEDTIITTNLAILEKTFAVNTFGPFLLTQALLPNLLSSSNPKVGLMSSRVGSISDNSTGGAYAYRASKAALNSIGKSLAMDLKDSNVLVMSLHPGYVRSNLNPGAQMPRETVEPEQAAETLWKNIVGNEKLGMEKTGRFWHREGFELPW